jgi:recombination protein RecR
MKNREGAFALAHALHEASSYIHECSVCHSLTEHEICDICASTERDDQLFV